MSDENETIIDAITNLPDRNTALSISKTMNELGVTEFKIINEKKLEPKVELNRRHQFTNIPKFCEYIAKHKSENTTLYFDIESGLCHALINEYSTNGNPEIITCGVLNKKLFELIQIVERIDNSGALLSFVKNNKKNVANFLTFYQVMSQLKVSSSVEKLDIQGKSSEYSVIVKSEVKGVVKGGPVELPDGIEIQFNDFNFDINTPFSYFINADIYYSVKKDAEVSIEIKVSNKEELRSQMISNYYNSLQSNLPKDVLLVFGYPAHELVKRYERNY